MEKAITSNSQEQKPPVENKDATTLKNDQLQMVKKEEFEKVQDELKQARRLQSQSDKKAKQIERELKKLQRSTNSDSTFDVEEENEEEENPVPRNENISEEQEKDFVRRKIISMVYGNPIYLEVIQKDTTLRDFLDKEPLFILDEWIDAKCALEDAKEYFDKRVSMSKPENKKEVKKTDEEIPEAAPNLSSEGKVISSKKEDETGKSMDEKILSDLSKGR